MTRPIASPYGSLQLIGARLVVRDEHGGLLRRCTPDETLQLIAVIRQSLFEPVYFKTRFTIDGGMAITVHPGGGMVPMNITIAFCQNGGKTLLIDNDSYRNIAGALEDELGPAEYRDRLEVFCGFDEHGRLMIKKGAHHG